MANLLKRMFLFPWGRSLFLILGVTILAAGLRLYHLDFEPLHEDEIKQAQEILSPLTEIIPLSFKHQQPPLDYLIGKGIVMLFPATDFWQRLPAAISGIIAIAVLVLMLIRFGMPMAALIAGLLAATNPLLVQYSQYLRPYGLPVGLVVVTLGIYQHWRLGNRSILTAIAFAAFASMAVLSRALMPLLAMATLGLIGSIQTLQANNWRVERAVRNDPLTKVLLPLVAIFVWGPSFFYLRKFGRGFLASSDYDLGERVAIAIGHLIEYGDQAMNPIPLLITALLLPLVWLIPSARRALISTLYFWLPLFATGPLFTLAHSLTTRTDQFFTVRYLIFLPLALAIYFEIAAGAAISSALLTRQTGSTRWVAAGSADVSCSDFYQSPIHLQVTQRIQYSRLARSGPLHDSECDCRRCHHADRHSALPHGCLQQGFQIITTLLQRYRTASQTR
ncbi:glycosyltransferase family 39 protein [Opitutia bacterium ISCC 51]|nr:glycosyltransferase family 39 protein [Opitutae bacterium ISCC 51]QXD30177.1 glycosyltransferase family 39 protein [Opitutae bacterium ISCC 52]